MKTTGAVSVNMQSIVTLTQIKYSSTHCVRRAIVGSIPAGTKLRNNLDWVHTYVSVTKQYNFVLAKDGDFLRLGRWPQVWRKVTAAYRQGGWLKKLPAGWLPVHRDQRRAQHSVMSIGELCVFSRDKSLIITLFYTVCYRRNVICMLLTNSDLLNLMNSSRCVLTDLRNRLFPIALQVISDISFSIMQ